MAKNDLANAELASAITANDTVLAEIGGSVRRVPVSALTEDFPYDEATLSYGITKDLNNSSSVCTRIGNMDYHKSLPIHTLLYGCLLDDNGKETDVLPDSSWEGAPRDGSRGQVMVKLPQHYRKGTVYDDGTIEARISLYPLPGYEEIPAMYISAYEATVERSTNKLCSVVNTDADYRGGNNNADYDGTGATFLGRPASYISANNFRTYARNRGTAGLNGCGWNSYLYEAHKALYWLYVIEYANLNCQADYNAELTSEGYHQGGLGAGVTTLNSTYWSNFNGQYPFIPCGYTDALGNHTGVVDFVMPEEYGASLTVSVPRYRGIENPFGHIYKWFCDMLVTAHPNEANGGDNLNAFYVCRDPSKFATSLTDDYTFIGNGQGADGAWIYPTRIMMGSGCDIIGIDKGGSSSTYFCDGNYANNAVTADTLRGVSCGGNSSRGANAGLACVSSYYAPSSTHTYFGSRLCFLPE